MRPDPYSRQARRPGAVALLALLFVLFVAVLFLRNTVFVVRSITVEGNRYCTREEVLQSAGIYLGQSLFAIDTAKVRDGVNANRYLSFSGMWRDFPSHVILRVVELAPRATLTWRGILVMIAEDGIALDESPHIDLALSVPTVTGAQVASLRVGQPISYLLAGQGEAIESMLDELDFFNISKEVSELNVSVLDNLYLVTEDGLQIVLGSSDDLREKFALAQSLLPQLRQTKEVRGGVLDVTAGVTADFRPAKKTE